MDERDVFVLADQELVKVVGQIKDDQWDMDMPESFRPRNKGSDKAPVTLRQIINYHAYDDAWVPDILAGKTMDEAGKDKFDGDLLGDDPKGVFSILAEKAIVAAKEADPDRITHLTYGDFPAREYLMHITSFRGLRAFDIAKVIGADTTLNPELVQGMWDEFAPHAEEWRKMGVFGPKVEVPDDAPLQDKLLAMTGRNPR